MARALQDFSKIIPWIGLAILCTSLAGQSDQRLRIQSADLGESGIINGRSVQILSGNVIFRKGDMEMYTQRAIYYPDLEIAEFSGQVRMIRPDEELLSDSLIVNGLEDRQHAIGNVQFRRKNMTVASREFLYWTALDSGVALGGVVMTQQDRRLTTQELHLKTSDQGDRGTSFSAIGAVDLSESNRQVTGDQMVYDDPSGVLTLTGRAAIRSEDRDIHGEIIQLYYSSDTLRSVNVRGGAEATSYLQAMLSPTIREWQNFTDVMTSRQMSALLVNDKLSELWLNGMATSIYHVVQDSILQGVNHASGDTMALSFSSESELVRIQVLGGARGRFEPEEGNTSVDTVVVYRSDYIDYKIPEQTTFLDSSAQVDYRDNGLAAGRIIVTWNDNLLRAEPGHEERPTLHQMGHDPIVGELMEFDLVSERGRVLRGRTQLDDGDYRGEMLYREPGDIYYVAESIYTTCDLDRPHFHFASSQMKMIQGDKVIARPIVLYLMDVPLLGLPFIVFPNQTGNRRTGWIMPTYGETRESGQYILDLGFFWAINDYMDITTLLDFFTKRGVRIQERMRYNKRYEYSGRVNVDIFRTVGNRNIGTLFGESSEVEWSMAWRHKHIFDPREGLNIDIKYTSDPLINRNFGTDLRTRLNQQFVSSAGYYNSWRNMSLSASIQERYDLQARSRLDTPPSRLGQKNEERTRTLPNITISRKSTSLFSASQEATRSWYHDIRWSSSSILTNSQSVYWEAVADTANPDSLYWPEDRTVFNRYSARHNLGLTAQLKIFQYISTTAGINIQEGWVPSYRLPLKDSTGAFIKEEGIIQYQEVNRFGRRATGNLSFTTQTNIYGLIPFEAGTFRAIRHIIKPSITYTYTPDFSKPVLGHDFGYVERKGGDVFDRFSGSAIGGTQSGQQQVMSIRISNVFQARQEVDGEERKPTLLTWTMGTSYNFAADSLKLSPISSSFRSPLLDRLNLNVSMVHDFYDANEQNRRINKRLAIPRLSQMNASTQISLAGKRFIPLTDEEEALLLDETDTLDTEAFYGDELSETRTIVKPEVDPGNLWEATFALQYSLRPSLGCSNGGLQQIWLIEISI
ncbi:putative LPS assembly protein LptD, partial [Candidatus Neomarinimicrobiota bacterium]